MQRRLHLDADSPSDRTVAVDRLAIEVELYELTNSRTKLAAAIAPAAMARVSVLAPFVRAMRNRGMLNDLNRDEVEGFLRPIFEEAGIAEDFVAEVDR